jgi:hypothetical protein
MSKANARGYAMFAKKMGNARVKFLASVVMFCGGVTMLSSAVATDLNGGGATLPAGAYVGWNFLNTSDPHYDPLHDRLTKNIQLFAGSLFGAGKGAANTVQYCQTGSGAGKRVFDGDTSGIPPFSPTGVCGNFIDPSSTQGFSTPVSALVQPDFAASDVPLADSEYTLFLTNKPAKLAPVQFPALVGSIAIAYHNSEADALGITLNLSESAVCSIFSGAFTTWNQVDSRLSADPIKVAYRSDGSGTSFNMTNHLAANCGLVAPNPQFRANQTFATAVASLPIASRISSNTNVLSSNGNPVEVSNVVANDFSIGYAEAANTLNHNFTTGLPSGSAVKFALVNGKDPIADMPGNYSVAATAMFPTPVVLDRIISSTQWNADGTAKLVTPTSSVPSGATGCMVLVDPSYYAKPGNTAQPNAYPIVAVTYLMAGHSGNSTDLPALRALLSLPYSHPTGVVTIGSGTGFSFLTNSTVTAIKVVQCTAA